LFESGTSKVQELERYISDDVERHGTRLVDLEKKLVSAYRESVCYLLYRDILGLTSRFRLLERLSKTKAYLKKRVMERQVLWPCMLRSHALTRKSLILKYRGEFADVLGEDYLGLRELGIADEFGLSALSVPKKLLRGKKGQNKPVATKITEPPPPFPPPPHFIPFTASMVEDQIGLLQNYYQNRFVLAASTEPSSAPPVLSAHPHNAQSSPYPLPSPMLGMSPADPTLRPPTIPTISPDLILLDDIPSPAQLKISPIGQIVKSGAAAKKKSATKTVVEGSVAGSVGTPIPDTGPDSMAAKKKKPTASTSVASVNGRKKKPDGPGSASRPIFGGQGGPILPAVVIASA